MKYIEFDIYGATGIAAGAYLVMHDSPWWAALCFALSLLSGRVKP